MNRMLILAGAGVVALLALWRPAAAPSVPAISSAPPVPQHSRKGHPSRSGPSVAIVYVAGAVVHPGLYALAPGARIDDAVRRAGGFRTDADPDAVNLADRIADAEEIRVARVGESTPHPARRRAARRLRATPGAPLDINTADAASIASLPGIGATLVARIVEYRQLNGPFASLDELADVAGMTQRRIDSITPYTTLHEAP